MQRYFSDNCLNNIFTLSKEDSYHITKVMRFKIGEKIEIVYNNKTCISETISLEQNVTARIIDEIIEDTEISYNVTLVQS